MKSGNWWKVIVVAILGIAVVGVIHIKTAPTVDGPPSVEAVEPVVAIHEVAVAAPATPEAVAVPPAKPMEQPVSVKTHEAKETQPSKAAKHTPVTPPAPVVPTPAPPKQAAPVKKATFIELGADQCIPCKMMQPVMEELRQQYPATLTVVFHDVWKDPAAAEKYGVQSIPTQVLLDGDGKEVYRHVGFWPKEEIVAKYRELGIALE